MLVMNYDQPTTAKNYKKEQASPINTQELQKTRNDYQKPKPRKE